MFDWFDDAGELEENEYREEIVPFNLPFNHIYMLLKSFIYHVSIISLIILFIQNVFNLKQNIFDLYSLNGLLLNTICFGSLFFITNIVIKLFFKLMNKIKQFYIMNIIETLEKSDCWISTTIWFLLLQKYLSKFQEYNETEKYFNVLQNCVKCGFITAVSCFVLAVYLRIFLHKFINQRVKDRKIETQKSEKALRIFKNYRFELETNEFQEEAEPECYTFNLFNLKNLFTDILNNEKQEILIFKEPEIKSVTEAQVLAKEVFQRASKDGIHLTFEEFANIFGDSNLALVYFNRFDFDNNHTIEREEFRNTIIQFYLDRINLEKSINVAKKFVNIINNLITCVYVFILLFVYLVIWGLQLKKLLAVSLSSAILINFSISKVAKHFYKSLLILLSHPYDIGDEIFIDKKLFIVSKIGFATTSFIAENGAIIKYLNSEMWKKNVFNLTRGPEQLLIFHFSLSPETEISIFSALKRKIASFISDRSYDYCSSFSLRNQFEEFCSIKKIDCALILRNKNHKNRSKRLYMRTEFTKYLLKCFEELKVKIYD